LEKAANRSRPLKIAIVAVKCDSMSMHPCKNSQAVKSGATLKSLGEKSSEIKGGGQEIAINILRFISFNS